MKATTKLNNIQVLRAFAAIVVVVFHTGYLFPGLRPFGSFGVDVFFVISGYIMARILDPQSDSNSDHFFRRRVLRIVPPYWFFTILLYLVALRLPQLMGSTRPRLAELVKSLLFIPFVKGSGLLEPLLFIGWSLNYEMFFYFALAVGIVLSARFSATRHPILATPVVPGALLVLATVVLARFFSAPGSVASFYARDVILEFLLGIGVYYAARAVSDPLARRLRLPALAVCIATGLLLIAVQAILPPAEISRVLTLGIPSFFLVLSASILSQAGWDTNLKLLVLIGDASYILYLIHPYCEYSIDRILGPRLHWLRTATPTGALISVTASIAVALLIHLYGERPTVKFLNKNFGGKRKSVEFSSPRG